VQQKVAEILAARDEFLFEPWFRSRQVAYELRRLQTVPEKQKWTVWYEREGCLACGGRERPHGGNGLCSNCYVRISQALKSIVRQLTEENTGGAPHIPRKGMWRSSVREELSTKEAAAAVGVTDKTLRAWIAAGKVHAPQPTLRGTVHIRLWTAAEVEQLRREMSGLYHPGRGRRPRPHKEAP